MGVVHLVIMKNNEYNHTKVNNEGPSSLAEFTVAQSAEATFHNENKPHKDELNDRKPINDSIDKSAINNHKKAGKIDYKKIKDGTTHLTSSAGHAVVAASTVSVAVVAVAVGVSVIFDPVEDDVITFISSEITSNSIDFAFSFPSKLLSYNEDQPQDVETWKELSVSVYNEVDSITQIVEGYEELTPDVLAAYCYVDGLTAGTSYALSIDYHQYYYEITGTDEKPEVKEYSKQLAFRNFTTTEVSKDIEVTFSIEASFNSMRFYADLPRDIALDPNTGRVNRNLEFVVAFNDDNETTCYLLADHSESGDLVTLIGGCDGLLSGTNYELRCYQTIDNNRNLLASEQFVTEETPTPYFYNIEPTFSTVSFDVEVAKEYSKSEAFGRDLEVVIENQSFSTTTYVSEWSETSPDIMTGHGSASGLEGSTTYSIALYRIDGNDRVLIALDQFTTEATPIPTFSNIEATYNSVEFDIEVDKALSDAADFGEDLEITISDGESAQSLLIGEWTETIIGIMTGHGGFADLTKLTTYTLSIYKINGNDRTLLASEEFTTEDLPTPSFYDIETTFNSVSFSLDVNVGFSDDAEDFGRDLEIHIENDEYNETLNNFSWEEKDEDEMTTQGSFDILEGSTTYYLKLYKSLENDDYALLASQEFTTGVTPTVTFENIEAGFDYISYSFICPREVSGLDRDPTGQGSLTLEAIISGPNEYYESTFIQEYEEYDDDNIICYGTFNDLVGESEYTITISFLTQSQVINIGTTTVTTSAIPYGYNETVFSDKASYYNHIFDVTLDYYDDDESPNYVDFALVLKDSGGSQLQKFNLQAITTTQTLEVEYSEVQDGNDFIKEYSYDLDQEFTYSIEAFSKYDNSIVELDSGTVSFTNSDDNRVIGFNNDRFVVNTQESDGRMPISINFVNESHNWRQFLIEFEFNGGSRADVSDPVVFSSTVSALEGWQYIDFQYVNDSIISSYLGQTANITIYDTESGTSLYATSALIEESDAWQIFDVEIDPAYISENSQDVYLYVYYVSYWNDRLSTKIVFVDEQSGEEFIYVISLSDYPEPNSIFNLMAIYSAPSGYEFAPIESLAATFSGKTFSVYIRYGVVDYSTGEEGDTTDLLIQSNYSFIFD